MENNENNSENNTSDNTLDNPTENANGTERTNVEQVTDDNNSEPGQVTESNESDTTIGTVEDTQSQEEKPIQTVNEIINMKKDEKEGEQPTPEKPVKEKVKKEIEQPKQNYAGLWIALIVLLVCAGLYYWQNLQKKKDEENETLDAESEIVNNE